MPNPLYRVGDKVLVKLPEGGVIVARILKITTGSPNAYLLNCDNVTALLPESDIIRLFY